MQSIELTCADGRVLAGSYYPPHGAQARALLLINPALAVSQRFYSPLAEHLARQGYAVLCWDPRGIAASRRGPPREEAARLRDWAQLDLEAALQHAHVNLGYAWDEIVLIGHSAGGNLSGLAPSLARLRRLVLIASGSCDWRLYPPSQWPRLWLAWGLAMPLAERLFGQVPGRLGLGQDLPRGVSAEWRRWSLQRGYVFAVPELDQSGYAGFSGRLLALSASDDLGFAPPRTVQALLAQFRSARIEHQVLVPRQLGLKRIGHFGFFREASLWPQLDAWLARA